MPYEMINTQEAIMLFRLLVYPSGQTRVLRLFGGTKLGKSHLLTKVFPALAEEDFQARYAILDLRNTAHTIADILNMACAQLDHLAFNHFYSAHKEWVNRPKVGIQQLYAIFSRVSISAKDNSSDLHRWENYLTTAFIKDLNALSDKPLLLFFDSIDRADENIQMWLMDTFLVHLALTSTSHVRVVIAGQSLREPNGSYAARCKSYELLPVRDIEAYVDYCERVKILLSKQSIQDFARAFGYKPGIFVDYVLPAFTREIVPGKVHNE